MGVEKGTIIILIEISIIILIEIFHLVSYFFIKETDFSNIFDSVESSPLFDFSIEDNCGVKSHVVFQVWQGRKEEEYYYRNGHLNSRTKIVDRTNIKKLNGKLFCYKHISYKELLYNGQIRKEEEQYSGDYLKDCGIIDTLKQHLYIKDDEKCPLYDAGIGKGVDLTNYNYFEYPYEVYYNKDNYNEPNKKIIGKLILNDGQPCYRLNETLWRKFDSKEAGEEHLKCDLEVYGKFNDERFKHKGDITYNQIYQDNLSDENYELLKNKLSDSKVSLYSREFLGIDKACDEKINISKDKYEKLKKNQEMEKICLIIESVFSLFLSIFFIIMVIIIKIRFRQNIEVIILAFLLLYLLLLFICIICHSVFLGRINYYDLSYECSDDITNEVTKKENENTKKFVLYTSINLGLDIFIILINALAILINYLIKKFKKKKISYNWRPKPEIKEKNFDFNSPQNKFSSDRIMKEVNMDNRAPIQEIQINKPIDNITPNNNNINDLGVPPPPISQKAS